MNTHQKEVYNDLLRQRDQVCAAITIMEQLYGTEVVKPSTRPFSYKNSLTGKSITFLSEKRRFEDWFICADAMRLLVEAGISDKADKSMFTAVWRSLQRMCGRGILESKPGKFPANGQFYRYKTTETN